MSQLERNKETDLKIAVGVTNIEKDYAIWKAYSDQGGIYDMLESFNQSVLKPAVNAMEYDEDENTYIICITLYNSVFLRIRRILDKLGQNIVIAEQKGREYVPRTKKIPFTEENAPVIPKRASADNKLIKCMQSIDRWLIRFKFYKKIRCLIVKEEETSKIPASQYTDTVEVYREGELKQASYQMRYTTLLQSLTKIAEEMDRQLKPINEKNEKLLSDYMNKAIEIRELIKSEILSHREWLL